MGVGFIGRVLVGGPLAGHREAAGHDVFGTGRSGLPKSLEGRGIVARGAAEV